MKKTKRDGHDKSESAIQRGRYGSTMMSDDNSPAIDTSDLHRAAEQGMAGNKPRQRGGEAGRDLPDDVGE